MNNAMAVPLIENCIKLISGDGSCDPLHSVTWHTAHCYGLVAMAFNVGAIDATQWKQFEVDIKSAEDAARKRVIDQQKEIQKNALSTPT